MKEGNHESGGKPLKPVFSDYHLENFRGKRVRVVWKDGRKEIGFLQRDSTRRFWELLRGDAFKTPNAPPGVGEVLFLNEIESVEEFTLL